MSADPVILKILAGMQAGVEVALAEGTYLLGTGSDDDIQLVDVSLLPGHARLRIGPGKAEIASQAGTVQVGFGETLTPDQGWRALEPLETVTAGTTRFALGPRSANWASVAEDAPRTPVAAEAGQAPPPYAPVGRARALALPAVALLLVVLFGGWYALTGGRLPSSEADHARDMRRVRTALDAFPFGPPINVRQEVDGAIYISGYVETPVQRRALAGALDRTDIPLHLRLFVLEDMRREIAALVGAEKVAVTSALSDKGEVTLEGLVLKPARERKLAADIGDTVPGVSGVTSHVRTAETLLDAVRQLAVASLLKPWLILRLDGDVIEVSGALPSDKVDEWVGFLQTYATRFAGEIPLRSFVQLQSPNGTLTPALGVTGALAVGGGPSGLGDRAVDVERLRRGDFKLGDIFVGAGGGRDRAPNAPGASARTGADAAVRETGVGRGAPGAASIASPAGAAPSDAVRRMASDASATNRDGRPEAGMGVAAIIGPGGRLSGPSSGGLAGPPGAGQAPAAASGGPAAGTARAETGAETASRETGVGRGAPGAKSIASTAVVASSDAVRRVTSDGSETARDGRAESGLEIAAVTRSDGRLSGRSGEGLAGQPIAGQAPTAASGGPAAGLASTSTGQEATGQASGTGRGAPSPGSARPGEADAVDRPVARIGNPVSDGSRSASTPVEGQAATGTRTAETSGSTVDGGRSRGDSAGSGPALLTASAALQTVPEQLTADSQAGEARAADALAGRAAQALKRFRDGKSGGDDNDLAIDRALALLESSQNGAIRSAAGGQPIADWYLPLFVDPQAPNSGAAPCWDGTALTAADLLPVLFWLDVLSASRLVALTAFDQQQQAVLIEAALDPREIRACSLRTPEAAKAADHSLYLREVSRNPGFVGFVLRDLPTNDLDVAGASLGRRRFIITRAGARMAEGAAPDRSSRVAVVGELGVALQHQDGLSVQLFGPEISWVVAN